jgi:hypothetical protein
VRRTDQVTAGLLLAFAAGYGTVALRFYPYWGANGPGSGFLPVWLAATMAVLGVLLFLGACRRPDAGGRWLPRGEGLVRLVAVIGATGALIALLPVLGMIPGTALFLVALLRGIERYAWATSLLVAAGAALTNHLIFARWLGVPFPAGVLGF